NKILVSLRSPDGKDAVIKFSMGSGALQVLGALNAADLTQPVTLKNFFFAAGTKGKDKTGAEVVRAKDEVRLVGYQGDQKLANKYGEGEVVIPKVDKIEVKNPQGKVISTVNDFTAQQEFTLNLAREVNAKVLAATGAQPAPVAPQSQPAPAAAAEEDTPLNASDILGEEDGGLGDAAAFAQN
ncbi:hypothetical protein DVK02_15850, partial [Halobellus sp. Atlit-31R]